MFYDDSFCMKGGGNLGVVYPETCVSFHSMLLLAALLATLNNNTVQQRSLTTHS